MSRNNARCYASLRKFGGHHDDGLLQHGAQSSRRQGLGDDRDFNNYPGYIDGVTESAIEDDKRGDEIGAVRRFNYGGHWIRQRLGDHSDERRSLTYIGIDPFALPDKALSPVRYQGTMHVLPVVEGARSFIEWSVELDAAPGEAREGTTSSWR